jgi:hypothetical protein
MAFVGFGWRVFKSVHTDIQRGKSEGLIRIVSHLLNEQTRSTRHHQQQAQTAKQQRLLTATNSSKFPKTSAITKCNTAVFIQQMFS